MTEEMGVYVAKSIVVTVEGGMVQSVEGVPADWRLEVRDYDIETGDEDDRFEEDEYGNLYRSYVWEAQ